jgi:hypothetical protein
MAIFGRIPECKNMIGRRDLTMARIKTVVVSRDPSRMVPDSFTRK